MSTVILMKALYMSDRVLVAVGMDRTLVRTADRHWDKMMSMHLDKIEIGHLTA